MPRVKRGTHHVKRRKNILARTKGMMWGRKSKVSLANTAVLKAGVNAYRDRKNKKRNNRGLQQVRINAAARALGTKYSVLMNDLRKKSVELNRKVLSEIGRDYPKVFEKLVR
ncbi:50S ribosomal protein L20 [Patescibacteria group bacterium]|nr:50S ribosomal protein L20 [Patescibacteria group bacterium]